MISKVMIVKNKMELFNLTDTIGMTMKYPTVKDLVKYGKIMMILLK